MNKAACFTFMRRAQSADTHALKQPRLSQNISPVCSSLVLVITSDMHLESESEKRAKIVDFHTPKNIQIQPTLFSLFLDQFLQIDLRPSYCSLTCYGQYDVLRVYTRHYYRTIILHSTYNLHTNMGSDNGHFCDLAPHR